MGTRTSNSTTPSSSLDTAPTSAPPALWTTGSSGTAGENPGERMATSGSFERQTHSAEWTQQLLDMSARTVLAFPTPSTCVACAECSSRPPSLSELISSERGFWFRNCMNKQFGVWLKKKKKKKKKVLALIPLL